MRQIVGVLQARVQLAQALEVCIQVLPGVGSGLWHVIPGALVAATTIAGAAMRHGLLDRAAHACELVRQVTGHQRGARSDHAAANVDTDRCRDDGVTGRNHRTHGRAYAQMHIRHGCHMRPHDRKPRDLLELATGRVLDRHALDPHAHRDAARCFDSLVVAHLLSPLGGDEA